MQFSPFSILKISATGNDFLLIDLRRAKAQEQWQKDFASKTRRAWTKLWCDRHEALGADGAIFLDNDSQLDFAWDFYNADGGSAEMCGNAARAVSLYFAITESKSTLKFKSVVGTVEAKIFSAEQIEVTLPAVQEAEWALKLDAQKTFAFVRAGVPHAILEVDDVHDQNVLRPWAARIKALPRFQAAGTNVTFVKKRSATELDSVTFERGVEDFTKACGTGAIAAAHWLLRAKENTRVEVRVPGGPLSVIWTQGHPVLRGAAKIVAEIHLLVEPIVCP